MNKMMARVGPSPMRILDCRQDQQFEYRHRDEDDGEVDVGEDTATGMLCSMPLRDLPSVDALVRSLPATGLPRSLVIECVRTAIARRGNRSAGETKKILW